jgi:hypothetical protein
MPGFLLHVGIIGMCLHGGQLSEITSNMRVSVSNQKVVTVNDIFLIAGCLLSGSVPPNPCITVKWVVPATRVFVSGQPVLLSDSVGLCQTATQAPQGPPTIVSTQLRVKGM